MKKVLIILVFMMTALAVNAQAKATTTHAKPAAMVVKIADLPKPITDNIAKDFAGFNIKDATCTSANNVVTYEVNVVKGMDKETLSYDKDGKLIKKVAHMGTMKPAPKKK